jgi:tRNA nucleotidyltransferase (CCA-adding enzyme)
MRIGELLIYEERLNIKPIISTPIQTLDKVFKDNNHEMRIVGGAVRDIVLGKSPKDIDFATDATPDEMIAILDKAGISYKPTGLEHGTITAIIDREPFEITTLRADTETDGRHAEVEFVRSWEEDAKRRDLTYNAMSMDIDGNVYDYFNGMDDLQDKVSKFVGDPEERITEDYLRILRYFRFQGRLSTPTWDGDTLNSISTHAKGLTQISAERVWQEMSKLLAGQNVASVLAMMEKAGVSKVIGLATNDLTKVKDRGNPIVALAQLGNSIDIAKRWRLSNTEAVLLDFLVKNKNNILDQKKVEDMIADGVDKEKISALATLQGQSKMADHAVTANVPDFPVTGADLIAKGMKPGPEMGAKLSQLKQQWKQSNFTATKDDLLTEWNWKKPFKFPRPDVIGSKIKDNPIKTIKLPVGNLKKWMKEDSDLDTQRGRLEYYLKQSIDDGMLVRLYKLGKFHQGADPLAEIVPERNGGFALHPDKWESTFYSLTNKDFKKIGYYKPIIIEAPANMIVADMAIANQFYRTDDPNERSRLANAYKDSMGKDISNIKMPEVLIPGVTNEKITKNTSMGDVIKDFYKSDAPQFKGKSKAKKRQMAIAAKLSLDENQDLKNVN